MVADLQVWSLYAVCGVDMVADLQVWSLYVVCGVGYGGRSAGLEPLRSVWGRIYGGRSAGLESLRSVWGRVWWPICRSRASTQSVG